ncbi:hypothetical protein D3C87_419910 [compost metagenome]
MFDKYSYKIKFKALLVLFCMLSFTAYKRSFSTLKEVIFENNELTLKYEKLNEESGNLNVLKSEIESIDKVIGKEGINKEKIQQDILAFTSNYAVSVYNLRSIHEFTDVSHKIYTNEIDITGSLNQLLKLSYDFEKSTDYSRLVSMNFYTSKKDNKVDILHLKMIFQNYENNN